MNSDAQDQQPPRLEAGGGGERYNGNEWQQARLGGGGWRWCGLRCATSPWRCEAGPRQPRYRPIADTAAAGEAREAREAGPAHTLFTTQPLLPGCWAGELSRAGEAS